MTSDIPPPADSCSHAASGYCDECLYWLDPEAFAGYSGEGDHA